MINVNNIFKQFEGDSKEDSSIFEKSSPLMKIGMFKKLLINYFNVYSKIVDERYSEHPNYKEYKKSIEKNFFNKSFEQIKDLDLNDVEVKKAIEFYYDENLIIVTTYSLKYFEILEEFEKCIVLKNILDFMKKKKEFQL
jgi:hypothetical protein